MRWKARMRNLDLAALYLADGAPQEWPHALEDDERAKDRADLAARGLEISLDLLDGGFEFDVVEFRLFSN